MANKKYSEEQLLWIKNNYSNFKSVKEATSQFNKKFSMNITKSAMTTKAKRLGCGKLSCYYTQEQIKWIKDNHENYSTRQELADAYNLKFSENKTERAIEFQCCQLGLVECISHTYTPEEDEWLTDNYQNYAWNDLSKEFAKVFNIQVTGNGLRNHCRDTLNLKRENSHVVIRNKKYKVGDEVEYNNGYIYVKVKEYQRDENGWSNKKARECWKSKQTIIWEKHYGQVPDDCQIIFLNNNKEDFRIENLYCIKKQNLIYMIRNKWFSDNPEITLTAIKWCELMYATQK